MGASKARRITRAVREVPFAKEIYEAMGSKRYRKAMAEQVMINEPPARGISPLLKADFPHITWDTTLRQVIGVIIRETMEGMGWEPYQRAVRIPHDPIFQTAMTYKQKAVKDGDLLPEVKYYIDRIVGDLNELERKYLKSKL